MVTAFDPSINIHSYFDKIICVLFCLPCNINLVMGRFYQFLKKLLNSLCSGVRCSSVVTVFAYGVVDRHIDSSLWTH